MVAHITFHGLVAVDLDCSVALGGRAPDASIKDFEWDEAKSEACFAERGFDFAYAARAFFDPDRLVMADTRYSYGEDRYQLIGKIERRLARPTRKRSVTMKTVRMKIDPAILATLASARLDTARFDATVETDIAKQEASDEADPMQDAVKFARPVRKHLGLS